jgi:ABC-type sugar transport system ATPase subunit
LKEVFTLADKVVVLRDGKFIAKNSINEVTHKKLIKLMIGKKIEDNPIRSSKISDKEILKIKNLNISNRNDIILSKINFSLKKGEVLGIAGLLGAGRTELLKFLFGKLEGRAIGGIRYINKKYVPQSPIDAINRGIIYLPEDRKREGNFNNLNLVFNYSISILEQLTKFCFIDTEKEKNEVIDIFDTLNVKRTSILQKINTLSGGNQQKVLLSRMLSIEPYLLMLDEPTRGIDVGAKQEIYDLIKDLSSKGLSIIMTSSEISELLKVCHKIAVLSHGKQTALLQAKGTDSKEILHYSIKQG